MARVSRRRRGRGPSVRHRQVEHVPLALGRVGVAAAVPGRVGEVRVAATIEKYVDSRVHDASVSLTLLEKKMRNVVSGRRKRMN